MEKGLEDPEASDPVGGLDQDDANSQNQGGGQQPWTAPKHLLQAGNKMMECKVKTLQKMHQIELLQYTQWQELDVLNSTALNGYGGGFSFTY